ncbi:hypothetical protein NMG60_11022673 [Bertholletia excelsa]
MGERSDPYASMLQECRRCNPSTRSSSKDDDNPTTLVSQPTTQSLQRFCFMDRLPESLSGAIIPPESLDEYLLLTPEMPQCTDNDNDNREDIVEGHSAPFCAEYSQIPSQTPSQSPVAPAGNLEKADVDHQGNIKNTFESQHTPFCVQSFQILSPPSSQSSIASSNEGETANLDILDIGQSVDCGRAGTDHDEGEGEGVSVVSQFRRSTYGSAAPPLTWLWQLKAMARLERIFDGPVSVVSRFRFSTYRFAAPPLTWLSQLKAMARQEGYFGNSIFVLSAFRRSWYWFPGVELPPTSKTKHLGRSKESTLRIPSSVSEGVTVIFLLDSDEDTHGTLDDYKSKEGRSSKGPGCLRAEVEFIVSRG